MFHAIQKISQERCQDLIPVNEAGSPGKRAGTMKKQVILLKIFVDRRNANLYYMNVCVIRTSVSAPDTHDQINFNMYSIMEVCKAWQTLNLPRRES